MTFGRMVLAGVMLAGWVASADSAPLKVLVSGSEGTSESAAYFPRVAKEMNFTLELVDARGDLEGTVRREQPRVLVLGETEATAELICRMRKLAPNAVVHVQEGWTRASSREHLLARAKAENFVVIPVGEAVRLYRGTEEGKAVDPAPGGVLSNEGRYLLGCVYLATLFPADMIQLIWWPSDIPCARAERIRIVAEKAAVGESARRAEDAPQAEKAKCLVWEQLNAMPAPGRVIGRLAVRKSKDIPSSRWSVGCETMDRDYAVFRNFRKYVGETGVKHARIQSGWEKTEKVRGKYDFAWFDEHVRGLAEEGVKPWVCLCYGNPIYNSSQRMRWAVARITEDPEGFPAWVRYVEETVKRYGDVVDTWEIWNEPFFKQVPYYAKLVKASCEAIRKFQPHARIWVSAPGKYENCELLVAALKANGAVDMVEGWVYHPYVKNPDAEHDDHFDWGTVNQGKLAALVRALGPQHYIVQGETGCPAQLEFSHALNNLPWTECSQAKWNLRGMMRAAANEVRLYSVFAMIDFQYTNFMLQSFGLLRADLAKEVVYRRPLYYACRNVFSLFDDTVKGEGIVPCSCRMVEWADANERGCPRTFTAAKFSKGGLPIVALWQSDRIPGDSRRFDRAAVAIPGVAFKEPVWVDLVTGRVCMLDDLDRVPVWDAPILIAERKAINVEPQTFRLAPNGDEDMAQPLLDAIRTLNEQGGGTLCLEPGDYHFRSPVKRNWYVSNHDNDLPRDVFLPMENVTNVTIVCPSRAEFVFHGNGIAIGVVGSSNVSVKGIGVDYSRPFNTEWRFVGFDDGMPVLETDPAKFPFSTEGGVLRNAGECLQAEERLLMAFGGNDHEKICADWVSGACQRLSENRIKMLTRIDKWRYVVRPESSDTVFVTRARRRPCPAVFVSRTERMLFEDAVVRASPGMGIICQLSGDITIRGSKTAADRTAGAMPREGSGRVTSLQADATHFSNCRGLVTVENCTFERMCDDAINVHSTCLRIDRLSPPDRLTVKFIHKQAKGFELFSPGETIRFIKARTMEPGAELVLRSARLIDPETYELETVGQLPAGYAEGDTVENADWQPEVRFANNIVNRNVSRATLFTTPRRVVCEGNRFVRIPGAAIKLSGDSMNWFESGGCRDVVIRGNDFLNCRTSSNKGVIAIDPEIASPTGQVERYHRNIVVEDNRFETHDVPLLWACSVSNLVWRGNSIVRNNRYRSLRRKPLHFEFCEDVSINGVPAARHPDTSVEPDPTLMLLVSGNEEIAECENEINDLAEGSGFSLVLGNARGNLEGALWDGRWRVVLLDESEATESLLRTIADRAPQLEIVIQTRNTRASDWPQFRTIAVGGSTGKARAEILVRNIFGQRRMPSSANP